MSTNESAEERAHNDRLAEADASPFHSPGEMNVKDPDDGASPSPSPKENEMNEGKPLPFLRVAGQKKPAPKQYTVAGLVPKGEVIELFAPYSNAKSLIALKMGFDVAGDTDFFGLPTEHGGVLYLDAETNVDAFLRRCDLIAAAMGITALPDEVAAPVRLVYERVTKTLDAKEVARIKKLIDTMPFPIVLIIVDSFQFASNVNPVDPQQVTAFFKNIASWGISTVVLDHTRAPQVGETERATKAFGSSYKGNAVDAFFSLTGEKVPGGRKINIHPGKDRDGEQDKPGFSTVATFRGGTPATSVEFSEWMPISDGGPAASTPQTTADWIRVILKRKGATSEASKIQKSVIKHELDMTGNPVAMGTVDNTLSGLKASGLVEGDGDGSFWLKGDVSSSSPSPSLGEMKRETNKTGTFPDFGLLDRTIDVFLGCLPSTPCEFNLEVAEWDSRLQAEKRRLAALGDEEGLRVLFEQALRDFADFQAERWPLSY